MKTLRIGLIGFGFIGRAHAYSVQNIPLFYGKTDIRARITHVCTSNGKTADAAARTLGQSVVPVSDFREITENPEIDIVDIASPNDRHLEALLSAMARNKHIYCDKPLCANLAEAERVRTAWKDYRGISQMTLQYRFFPLVMRAKQLIEEGKIGDILEFRADFLHSGSADPAAPLKWKLSGAAGGGVAADLGVHIFDLLHFLAGDFSEVCAATRIAYPERPSASDPSRMVKVDAEDDMTAILKLKNGALGTVTASKIATGTQDGINLTIHGTKGAVSIKSMDLDRLYFYDGTASEIPFGGLRGWTVIDCGQRFGGEAMFPASKAVSGWLRGHLHCYYSFLRSVTDGTKAAPSIEQGIFLQELLEKVKLSASGKGWVGL